MPKTGGGLTFVDPKLTRPGNLNGHKTGGGLVYVNPHNSQNSQNKGKKKKKKKIDAIRGKEITIRDSAAPAQVIYGIMRVGGITTMIHTTALSSAYLQTGEQSSNNALLWSAITPGDAGNDLTVELYNPGPSNPTTTCTLIGGVHVKITLATNGSGTITSTLNQVIGALQADVASSALMKCQKSFAGTNGIVTALSQTSLQYGGGEYLHQIITLAGHEIDSVMALYLDGREVVFGASPDNRWSTGYFTDSGGSLVFMAINYGTDDQIAQPDAVAQIPSIWTDNHRQRGCAHVYLLMRYSQSIFAEGLPEIEFLVKGKKVYDPRTGQTAFTDTFGNVIGQNAALIANDYLTNTRFGLGCTTVDQATLIAAANICDESVARVALPDEKRYVLNSSFDPTEGPENIIEEIEMGMAGKIFSRDGKIFIYPGAWRAPSVTFTVDDLRGDIIINQTHVPRSERFNYARGTYVSDVDFQETDIPPQKNDSYATEDGGVIYEDFPINFVTSPTQCQRILKIELEKVRQGIQVSVPLKLSGLLVAVGDIVNLSLPRYGWTPKIFEVMNFQIVVEDDGVVGVDLELRETASGIYDWNSGMETAGDTAPNTTLPSATNVGEPTGLTLTSGTSELYLRNDGTVFSRLKVSWTAPNDVFVVSGGRYVIEYKKSSSGTWLHGGDVPSSQTSIHILDVQDAVAYDVRVKAINTISVSSDWVQSLNHTVVGKTEKPASVTGLTASINNYGITLSWTKSTEVDVAGYRIKRHSSEDWNAATLVENLVTATQFENNFRRVGTWYYLVKAVDTSGNESTTATSVAITVSAPLQVASLDIRVTNNIVMIDWVEPTSTSFPVAKYRVYKGSSFGSATLLGEAFVTFQAYTEQFAGSSSFWVTAVDTGGNEGPETGKYVTWFNPPDTIQYAYNAIDADDSELAFAVMDETYPNSFIAPVRAGDTWTKHFTDGGWDKMLDQMVGYDSDAIKAISGLTAWFSANAEVTVDTNNAVSPIEDLKNTNHATQATTANKPFLTRADNQENFLTYSEQQSVTAAWDLTSYPCSVVDNDTTNYLGVQTAAKVTATAGSSRHGATWTKAGVRPVMVAAGDQYIFEVDVKAGTHTYAWIGISADSSWHGATLNLSTGAFTGNGSGVTKEVTDLGGGWYRVKLTITVVAQHRPDGGVWFATSANSSSPPTVVAAGTETLYITRAQLRRSGTDSTYIKSEAIHQLAGINGNRALLFDGTNDNFTTSLAVNPTGGMWGAAVVKISSLSATNSIYSVRTLASTDRVNFWISTTGSIEVAICSASYNTTRIARTTPAGTIVAGTTAVITWTYDGGTSSSGIKIYKNGVQVDNANNNAGSYAVPTAGGNLTIGQSNSGNFFNGLLPEIIFSQGSTLSDPDRAIIESYLAKFTTGDYALLEPFIGDEEGWLDEYTARGWTTIQNQIDAGFEIWIEPSETETAYFSRVVDTGVTIQSARVEVTYSETLLDGSVTVETYISTSADLITWTDHAEGIQVLANTFRFVRVELRIEGADEASLVRIGDPAINVGVRKATVTGRSTTSASGNVTVSIGTDFLSLDSIQLTPVGGTGKEVFPVFDYATLNPTSFDVLGYSAGSPAAVEFSYTVIGATGVL